ncbi:unnamed protein product [Orchesella dallaii]|uniref:EF-hand domain-containing protein n=1 Tax=Orchesella dallaii TaxID=48710 RepID=A0ABP1R9L9_9HEXA
MEVLMGILIEHQVHSQCCGGGHGAGLLGGKHCDDGTSATPCCGLSACNAFCCACKSGCRSGRKKRSTEDLITSAHHNHSRFDKDGDGHHDFDEAREILASGTCGNKSAILADFFVHFDKYDKNGDGKLSFEEMNA